MNCKVQQLRTLCAADVDWILRKLSRPGSDFQLKLATGGFDCPIAMVSDQGEMIGWARTEDWDGWRTLEAFVDPQYRRRGIATLAAAALVAYGAYDEKRVAVFRPSMEPLARRVGLLPSRFENRDGVWVPA